MTPCNTPERFVLYKVVPKKKKRQSLALFSAEEIKQRRSQDSKNSRIRRLAAEGKSLRKQRLQRSDFDTLEQWVAYQDVQAQQRRKRHYQKQKEKKEKRKAIDIAMSQADHDLALAFASVEDAQEKSNTTQVQIWEKFLQSKRPNTTTTDTNPSGAAGQPASGAVDQPTSGAAGIKKEDSDDESLEPTAPFARLKSEDDDDDEVVTGKKHKSTGRFYLCDTSSEDEDDDEKVGGGSLPVKKRKVKTSN